MAHKVRHCSKHLTSLWLLRTVTSVLTPLLLRCLTSSTLWLGVLMPSSFASCCRSSWKGGLTSCFLCCLLHAGWVLLPCHIWRTTRSRREVGLSSQHPVTRRPLPALPDPVSCGHDWPSPRSWFNSSYPFCNYDILMSPW